MTTLQATVVLACLTGLLSGCYESSEPLGEPERRPLDLRLSGDWLCRDPAQSDAPKEAHLWIIPFDEGRYYAEWRDGDDVSRYRAYPTTIGGERLLNVDELTFRVSGMKWVFMRYRLSSNDALRLSVVSEDALGELKGKAALQAIRRRASDDSLYEPFAVCTREP